MAEIEAFPLCWPVGRKRKRWADKARFEDIPFGRARDTLIRELQLLGATQMIISTNIPLRRDGVPYAARCQPQDCGVAVYFKLNNRPMVFACDEWNKIEHNIWAIAKTIDALRGIKRWGSGDMLERAFTGFQAIPPAPPPMRPWWEILQINRNTDRESLLRSRNRLALIHHPDKGGSPGKMQEINRAYEEALKEIR